MRNKILIIDDIELNRTLLSEMLKEDFDILVAQEGKEALQVLDENHDDIALILLDLIMPQMDGFQVLEEIKKRPWSYHIAIMIISSETTDKIETKCFDYGVSDFIHRPFDERLVKRRVSNVFALYQYQAGLELKIKQQTKKLNDQFLLLQKQAEQLKNSKQNVIDILGTVVEYRNLESGEHIKRVKSYTQILATQMMHDYPEYNLTKERIEVIVSASALHDIGKIAIPDSILMKPGKLTPDEYDFMKSHTTRGCEILENIENAWDAEYGKVSYEICRHHHERYDGNGYPDKLKGEKIPISAQIVSLADVYDALVNERVYKNAFSKEKAFQMITTGECGIFSPKLLDCLWNVRKEFEQIADQNHTE